METVTVRMARGDRNTSWGFGVTEADNRDVIIVNVIGGSLADRAGLRNGDILDQLEGLSNLDINAVDSILITSRDKIEIVVHRSSSGTQTRIWRPEVTETHGMRNGEERPFKVSLEHSNDTRAPEGFNSAALPFNTDPRVKHLQYNSPMSLYSNANVAESYVQQTQGIVDNSEASHLRQEQPAYLRSETYRLLKEEESRGANTLSNHPNPNGLPVCYACARPILGVMARAAGHDLHGDCLACATCGNSLRNVGHHFIEGKFYCDVHGRQRKNLASGAAIDPNLVVRSTPTAAHPVRQQENVHAFYQPEVMSRRPLSVSPAPNHHTTHTTYSNPKTQGPISPSSRGVPTNQNYGGGSEYARPAQARPVQSSPIPAPAPPPPSNPPPESRVPPSMRSAVSPRRASRAPRQWPPPKALPTNRFWQIDPATQRKEEHKNDPSTLSEMIAKSDKEPTSPTSKRANRRRRSHIDPNEVKTARDSQREAKKSQSQPLPQTPPQASPQKAELSPVSIPPSIPEGIHWTIIRGPSPPAPLKSPGATSPVPVRSPSPSMHPREFRPVEAAPAYHPPPVTENAPEIAKVSEKTATLPAPFIVEQKPSSLISLSPQTMTTNLSTPATPPFEDKPFISTQQQPSLTWKPQASPSGYRSVQPPQAQAPTSYKVAAAAQSSGSTVVNSALQKPRLVSESTETDPEKPNMLSVHETTDSSTSPIPTIRLERKKAEDGHSAYSVHMEAPSRLPCTSSPTPFDPSAKPAPFHSISFSGEQPPIQHQAYPRQEPSHQRHEAHHQQAQPEREQHQQYHQEPMNQVDRQPPTSYKQKELPSLQQAHQQVQPKSQQPPQQNVQQPVHQRPEPPVQYHQEPPRRIETQQPSVCTHKEEAQSYQGQPRQYVNHPPEQARQNVQQQYHEEQRQYHHEAPQQVMAQHQPTYTSREDAQLRRTQQQRPRQAEQPRTYQPQVREPQQAQHVQQHTAHSTLLSGPESSRRPPLSPPIIRIQRRSSDSESSAAPITSAPRPFGAMKKEAKLAKPLKKVDFSKATVIPDVPWTDNAEIVDESDILTETSRRSYDSSSPQFDDQNSDFLRAAGPYDGDESEMYDNKSDVTSTLDMETEDEQEAWMREELEIARKEELAQLESLKKAEKTDVPLVEEKEEWRQQAMELLNDETQNARDLAIVAALNDRLQGLRDMKDTDRERAIECIERHQRNLEDQQEQLSVLLDSAIVYLRNLDRVRERDDVRDSEEETLIEQLAETNTIMTDSLSDALLELDTIHFPVVVRTPNQIISDKLAKIAEPPVDTQSYARSTFDRSETTKHSHNNNITSNGSSNIGTRSEQRGHLQGAATHGGRIPYCEACKQQIRGAFVLATGLAWCPEHFVCANPQCGRRLLECGFVEENGQKYCEGCFELHIAPRCSKCSKPIVSDCLNALQKKWHPNCFTCAHCAKPFGNSAFYLENGAAYCEQDWNALFTTKCVSCRFAIEAGDRWVEALGSAFHSNCFNCSRCQTNLEGESFFAKNGQPYCKQHA